jgi:hypothetical protein
LRIENNIRAGAVSTRSATTRSGQGGGFFVDEGMTTARAAGTASVAPAASLDALLALQAIDDPLQARKKTIRRGRSLLDTLETLRADLLVGRISEGNLNQLTALIGQAREKADPKLDALLNDIELRARVELAKRGIFPAF